MALPLFMLKNLKMRISQKAGLACLFLIAIVVVILDIFRIALGDGDGSISLASLWDVLEPSIAVIISTLPTYRALFVSVNNPRASSYKTIKHSFKGGEEKRYGDTSLELRSGISTLQSGVVSSEAPSTSNEERRQGPNNQARDTTDAV